MKSSLKLFKILIPLALLLALATPVLAQNPPRINLLADPPINEFPANTEFVMWHASGMDAPGNTPIAAGHMGFYLEVDGVYVEPEGHYHFATSARDGRPNVVYSGSEYFFPEGLPEGFHTLTGYWYSACLTTGGPCENPMDPVVFSTETRTIYFYGP